MGPGKSLYEYYELAKAAGATQFMVSLENANFGAYWCEEGAYTNDKTSWGSSMNIYQVLPTQ